ncbi:hypothetical protein GCM10010276_82600 [Streptomyces longisporus]|uniref:Uncharacterized protein n=1 Tax=Streptomyces longisporus TaxID=1948 RepID=A0ABN3NF83_STRLO
MRAAGLTQPSIRTLTCGNPRKSRHRVPVRKAPRAYFLVIEKFCLQAFDRSSIRELESPAGHAAEAARCYRTRALSPVLPKTKGTPEPFTDEGTPFD